MQLLFLSFALQGTHFSIIGVLLRSKRQSGSARFPFTTVFEADSAPNEIDRHERIGQSPIDGRGAW